jgi:hypothetical protein
VAAAGEVVAAAGVVVAAAAVVVVEAAAAVVVLAEAAMEGEWGMAVATVEEWGTAVATVEEWGTAVATVRPTAAALDLGTPALGIRDTTLVNAGLPFAKHFAQRRNSSRQKLFQPQPLEPIFSATSRGSFYEGRSGRTG